MNRNKKIIISVLCVFCGMVIGLLLNILFADSGTIDASVPVDSPSISFQAPETEKAESSEGLLTAFALKCVPVFVGIFALSVAVNVFNNIIRCIL